MTERTAAGRGHVIAVTAATAVASAAAMVGWAVGHAPVSNPSLAVPSVAASLPPSQSHLSAVDPVAARVASLQAQVAALHRGLSPLLAQVDRLTSAADEQASALRQIAGSHGLPAPPVVAGGSDPSRRALPPAQPLGQVQPVQPAPEAAAPPPAPAPAPVAKTVAPVPAPAAHARTGASGAKH